MSVQHSHTFSAFYCKTVWLYASWWMPIQAICIAWHAFLHTGLIFSSQEVLCLELHAVGWIEREKLLLYSCLFVTCGNRNWASDIGRNARWVSSCKFRRLFPAARGALALHLNLWSPAPSPLSPFQPRSLEWCVWSPEDLRKESLKLDPSPQMTGSNSMSSGYCSLDEESDDFTFFTAKSTFFRQPQAKQIPKVVYEHEMDGIVKIERIYSQLIQKMRRCARKFVYGSALFYVELLWSKQFYDLICFEWQQYPVCFALWSTLLRLLKLDETGRWFFYTHTKAVTGAIPFQRVLKCPIEVCSLDNNQYLQGTNVQPLGVKKVQRCTFWKSTGPVTAFVYFFLIAFLWKHCRWKPLFRATANTFDLNKETFKE